MSQLASPNNSEPFPEIRDALLRKTTWVWVSAFFAAMFVALYWPFVWEFSLLCCFPVPLFCYGAISSGVIHRPGVKRICIAVVAVHCLLLAGTLYLWRVSPKSVGGDFGFGFVVIELALIGLLMRFARPSSSAQATSHPA